MSRLTDDDRAKAVLRRWREHPETMVTEEFQVQPDPWQLDVLRAFPANSRMAFKASKGVGKTSTLAWLILNFLATRPNPRIAATSITGDNLSQNLWPELAKWMAMSPYLSEMFTWTKTQIFSKRYPATWWAQARTWPRSGDATQQAHALAGLHAEFAMGVVDESSEVPQAVMATVEAVLGTGIETKVIQAGNPTRLDGPLYRACVQDRALWHVTTISGDPDNPKRSSLVKIDWAREQIASYGRDNPWVMVNVLGEFPESSINALLGVDEVERAMARHLRSDEYDWAQKRLGVDVARFGDDRTVIFPRQGLASFRPVVLRHMRTTDIAARVMMGSKRWGAELILVDDTGHWGHGVIDNLVTAGVNCIGINYAGKAINPRYKNKRAEFWIKGAEAIRAGAALPNLPEMVGELTTPTYTFSGGVFQLEDKDQIKMRLGRSPDLADAYMQTYALEDMPGETIQRLPGYDRSKARRDADPFEVGETGIVAHDQEPFM